MLMAIMGGLLIGLSVSLMLLMSGRITGISGILSSILRPGEPDKGWRFLFLAGLILGGLAISMFQPLVKFQTVANMGDFVFAGLLVGIGTVMGSGCTSGHGVCGISRLSKRSIIATMTFMASGIVSVLIFKFFRGEL